MFSRLQWSPPCFSVIVLRCGQPTLQIFRGLVYIPQFPAEVWFHLVIRNAQAPRLCTCLPYAALRTSIPRGSDESVENLKSLPPLQPAWHNAHMVVGSWNLIIYNMTSYQFPSSPSNRIYATPTHLRQYILTITPQLLPPKTSQLDKRPPVNTAQYLHVLLLMVIHQVKDWLERVSDRSK